MTPRPFVSSCLVGSILLGAPGYEAPAPAARNPLAAQSSYIVRDLGTLGDDSEGVALNNNGQVVVTYATRKSGDIRAFLWDAGRRIELGTLGGSNINAHDINERGQIVGTSQGRRDDALAFVWTAGRMTQLRGLRGASAQAFGISENGTIAGHSTVNDVDRAVIWRNGRISDIGPTSPDATSARKINRAGDVIINIGGDVGPLQIAYYLGARREVPAWLDGFSGRQAVATDLNDDKQIVGYSGTRRDSERAALWHGTASQNFRDGTARIKPVNLGTLPGYTRSQALAINARGQIVGRAVRGESERAVLWQNGRIIDLNRLITSNSGWLLLAAYDINDRGQITGAGALNGQRRAFVLTPNHGPGHAAPQPESAGPERDRSATKLQSGRILRISTRDLVLEANFEDPEVRRPMTFLLTRDTEFSHGSSRIDGRQMRPGTIVLIRYIENRGGLEAVNVYISPGRR